MIKEWKQRHVLPDKKSLMNKYPSVMNYIAGRKNDKSVMKVFLEKEDGEVERYLREKCFEIDKLEYIYAETLMNDTQFIKEAPPVDRHTRKRLQKIIRDEEDKTVALYSNIVGIGVGRVKLNEIKFGDPCIVLYCLDKSLVPFGEKKLPNFLKGCVVDTREDFFMFGSCKNCEQLDKGCCIGRAGEESAGSVGFLVKQTNRSTNECGLLTAAHFTYGNISELNKSLTPVYGDYHKIVHPAMSDNVIGHVTKAFCGNRKTNEYEKGIDVAFVRFAEKENRGILVLLDIIMIW